MTYNTDLPPTIVRTNQTEGRTPDEYELRTASGTVITTYERVGMETGVWWEDILAYIRSETTNPMAAVEDITLLMIQQDWAVEG